MLQSKAIYSYTHYKTGKTVNQLILCRGESADDYKKELLGYRIAEGKFGAFSFGPIYSTKAECDASIVELNARCALAKSICGQQQ